MLVRIDPRSPHPIYVQIAESVAAQIEDGSLHPGERLPSARTLAHDLGVNMHTVLRAYGHLEDGGLVEKHKGRGGVVVAPRTSLMELTRKLTAAAKRQGVRRTELIEMVEQTW